MAKNPLQTVQKKAREYTRRLGRTVEKVIYPVEKDEAGRAKAFRTRYVAAGIVVVAGAAGAGYATARARALPLGGAATQTVTPPATPPPEDQEPAQQPQTVAQKIKKAVYAVGGGAHQAYTGFTNYLMKKGTSNLYAPVLGLGTKTGESSLAPRWSTVTFVKWDPKSVGSAGFGFTHDIGYVAIGTAYWKGSDGNWYATGKNPHNLPVKLPSAGTKLYGSPREGAASPGTFVPPSDVPQSQRDLAASIQAKAAQIDWGDPLLMTAAKAWRFKRNLITYYNKDFNIISSSHLGQHTRGEPTDHEYLNAKLDYILRVQEAMKDPVARRVLVSKGLSQLGDAMTFNPRTGEAMAKQSYPNKFSIPLRQNLLKSSEIRSTVGGQGLSAPEVADLLWIGKGGDWTNKVIPVYQTVKSPVKWTQDMFDIANREAKDPYYRLVDHRMSEARTGDPNKLAGMFYLKGTFTVDGKTVTDPIPYVDITGDQYAKIFWSLSYAPELVGQDPNPLWYSDLPGYLKKYGKEEAVELLVNRSRSPFYSESQIRAFEKTTGMKFDTVGWAMDTGYMAMLTTANSNVSKLFDALKGKGYRIASTTATLDNRMIRVLVAPPGAKPGGETGEGTQTRTIYVDPTTGQVYDEYHKPVTDLDYSLESAMPISYKDAERAGISPLLYSKLTGKPIDPTTLRRAIKPGGSIMNYGVDSQGRDTGDPNSLRQQIHKAIESETNFDWTWRNMKIDKDNTVLVDVRDPDTGEWKTVDTNIDFKQYDPLSRKPNPTDRARGYEGNEQVSSRAEARMAYYKATGR